MNGEAKPPAAGFAGDRSGDKSGGNAVTRG